MFRYKLRHIIYEYIPKGSACFSYNVRALSCLQSHGAVILAVYVTCNPEGVSHCVCGDVLLYVGFGVQHYGHLSSS